MTRMLTSAAIMALVLVVAACGSGTSASTSPTSTAEPLVTVPPSTTTDDSTEAPDVITDVSNNPEAFAALVERAEEEGTVTIYTSTSTEDMEAIEEMFEAAYDIDMVVIRSGGTEILQRFLLERDAGTVIADVLSHPEGGAWLDFYDNDYVQCFRTRFIDELHDFAVGPDGCFSAERGTAMGIAYRTDLIEEAGMVPPTGWQDLLDEKLQGRLALPNPNFSSFVAVVVTVMSEEMGWDYYEAVKENDPLIVPGGGQLMEVLEAGEVIVGGMSTTGRPQRASLAGLPIGYTYPEEGSYVSSQFSAVPVDAPNSNAGKLLADFLLTDEVQQYFADHGSYPGRRGFDAPEGMRSLEELDVLPIDYRLVAANAEEAVSRYTEIFEAPTE